MEHTTKWRKPNPHSGENMVNGIFKDVPATRIFDNVYFVGNDMMACYLLTTSEGLLMIDCMDRGFYDYIEASIRSLGFDPADLKAILITHGHGDHYGDSNIFREKYGTKLYMNKLDEEHFWDPEMKMRPRPGLNYKMDGYLEPGTCFVQGDTSIELYHTPGHTPGCMSMILTAYDEGRPAKLCIWGGTGTPRIPEWRKQQLASIDYFDACCAKAGVVGELSNHPFTDCTVERLEIVRNIVDGVPHPFVIGYEGVRKINLMYRDMYVDALKELAQA